MEFEIGPHLEEVELEQYSMGDLPEARLEAFEGHFLLCDACQDRLLEMECYVNAMRSASPKVRPAPTSVWSNLLLNLWPPRPAWVAAFALSVVALITGIWLATPVGRVEMAAVTLQASRGSEPSVAIAPAGKALMLKIALAELPFSSWYRLEVVDGSGNRLWEAVARPHNGAIEEPMTKPLATGQYFARLYLPSGQLLREFSLGVGAR